MSRRQLPQHVAEAIDRVELQAVRLAGERRQRVIGAENVARAVDQEDMVARFRVWPGRGSGCRRCGRWILLRLAWTECGRPAISTVCRWRCSESTADYSQGAGCARLQVCVLGRDPEAVRPLEQEPQEACRAHRPVHHQRADDAGEGDQHGDRADIGDQPGLEQDGAGHRHRQEKREIDDDRIPPAVAQRRNEIGPRQQHRADHHRGRAREAEGERDERPFGE